MRQRGSSDSRGSRLTRGLRASHGDERGVAPARDAPRARRGVPRSTTRPRVEHHDLVGVAHGGEAMRDHEAGDAARAQVRLDARLGRGVERAGGLVEDEDRRVAHQRARDLEALALAAATGCARLPAAARRARPRAPRISSSIAASRSAARMRVLAARGVPEREVVAHACPRRAPRPGPRRRPSARGARAVVRRARLAVEEDLAAPRRDRGPRRGAPSVDLPRARGADQRHAPAGLAA